MVAANSINEATTGIAGFTGIAFTATPVTNHAIILGGSTSSTLGGVGPSATAGQVLQSAGAAADPTFSTATYPATAGTSGNILTSNGTNWTSAAPATSGTVTSVSVASANGLAGTVANATTTPAITLSTTITGVLSGNGTSISGSSITQYDVLVGGASNAISSVGPGSAGQVLQSGGNAANPAYSTPTYPSTSGTLRKILVSDGTNNIYSTETWATPGSSGNILTSNGTNWTSAAPATSGTVTSVSGTANQVAVATGTTTPVISLIGPYTPATYTAHGVLVGEGTSSIAALATGSAGQVLQSGGASADPTYSTATFPSTATGTGKILRADGTNWVATTATYPDTAGTTGTYLTSDGTNWVNSSNALIYVTKNITSAQIKALHATPIEVVAAPGNGKILQLVGVPYLKFNYGGSNVFIAGASQTVSLTYGTATAISNVGITNAQLTGTTTGYDFPSSTTATLIAPASIENLALNLYNSVSTEITGNAANNNTITISFFYTIATLT